MSNPLGTQDLVGNLVSAENLLNKATLSNPAAIGTGLATTYVAGSIVLTATAVSNVFLMPYAETLMVLVSLTSGTASSVSINTGGTAATCVAVANTGAITDTNVHAVFVAMPSAALGTAQPGAPTAPYVSVSINTAACQVNQLALFPLGFVPAGADWFSIKGGGINAVASFVTNTKDATQPPANAVGSGAFSITG
jgi:hypothetical protein